MSFFGGGSKVSTPALQALAPTPTEDSVVAKANDTRKKLQANADKNNNLFNQYLGGQWESLGSTAMTGIGRSNV